MTYFVGLTWLALSIAAPAVDGLDWSMAGIVVVAIVYVAWEALR